MRGGSAPPFDWPSSLARADSPLQIDRDDALTRGPTASASQDPSYPDLAQWLPLTGCTRHPACHLPPRREPGARQSGSSPGQRAAASAGAADHARWHRAQYWRSRTRARQPPPGPYAGYSTCHGNSLRFFGVVRRPASFRKSLTRGLPTRGRFTFRRCHHNYVEEQGGLYLTRKGAVSAKLGELGIIPGSMGAKSFIVRGLGHPAPFEPCSHGAGRRMSRGAAKRAFTVGDVRAQTAGVECRKDAGIIDELPGAYKDIDAVMAAQRDLVEVVATLKALVSVKG